MPPKDIIRKQALIEVIKALDKRLDQPTPLTAIGGTALTLLDMKAGSFDIDFIKNERVQYSDFSPLVFNSKNPRSGTQ